MLEIMTFVSSSSQGVFHDRGRWEDMRLDSVPRSFESLVMVEILARFLRGGDGSDVRARLPRGTTGSDEVCELDFRNADSSLE